MNELLEKIRSRGHWKVVIHPATFVEKRVSNISDLYPILQKTSVQLRGWDFPQLDTHTAPHIDMDWIGQEIRWEQYLELWRFYQSGQFVYFSGMTEDWYDQSTLVRPPANWKPGASLDVADAVFRCTEIFEFAARLALTEAGDDQIHLEVTVKGIKGRALQLDLPGRARFFRERKASIPELLYELDLHQIHLIAEPRELALKPAIELFRRFDWDSSMDMLRDMQMELLRRGSLITGGR